MHSEALAVTRKLKPSWAADGHGACDSKAAPDVQGAGSRQAAAGDAAIDDARPAAADIVGDSDNVGGGDEDVIMGLTTPPQSRSRVTTARTRSGSMDIGDIDTALAAAVAACSHDGCLQPGQASQS